MVRARRSRNPARRLPLAAALRPGGALGAGRMFRAGALTRPWTTIWAAIFWTATVFSAPPREGWSALEKDLQSSLRRGEAENAKAILDRLAATGDPRGVRCLVEQGLRASEYEIYTHAAGLLAVLESAELRDVVYSALEKATDSKRKILLLAIVRGWPDDPKALDAIHRALSDERKEVVFSALRWVREIERPDSSMPALIAELARREKQPNGRIYLDIKETLRKFSGRDYELAADWKNYWAARSEGRDVPAPRAGRTTGARPRFFSVSIDSDRVVFVIDISGSMTYEDPVVERPQDAKRVTKEGITVVRIPGSEAEPGKEKPAKRSRMDAVKQELIRTLKVLPEAVRFNIVSFHHECQVFENVPGGLVPADAATKARAERWVQDLVPTGATRTDLALQAAFQLADLDTICLLTDGAPRDITKARIPNETVYGIVRGLNLFRKVRIHTVGFVRAELEMREFVDKLARQNDGQCVLLE